MATGLLQQGMAPQGGQPAPQAQPGQPSQQPAPQGQPGPQGRPGQGSSSADMDPQAGPRQRQKLVDAMLEALYGPLLQRAREILQQHQDEPVKGLARVIAQLLTVTWTRLAEEGKTVPPGVMVQAAMVIAQAVGEMAVRLRLIPEKGNGEVIESAFMLAMAEFGKSTAQQMPREHRQRYAQLLGAIRDGREQAMGGGQGQPPREGAPSRGGQRPPQGGQAAPRRQPQPDPRGGM